MCIKDSNRRMGDGMDQTIGRRHARCARAHGIDDDLPSLLCVAFTDVIHSPLVASIDFMVESDPADSSMVAGIGTGQLEITSHNAGHRSLLEWSLCFHLRASASATL